MADLYIARSIADLRPGEHLCCFYENDEEHRELLTRLLRRGLEQGERVLYSADTLDAKVALEYLRIDGLTPEPFLESGHLGTLTEDSHPTAGLDDCDGIVDFLRDESARATAEGYGALRVVGEAAWTLQRLGSLQRLIGCEARVNESVPNALLVCLYDRRKFDATLLLDVVATHPVLAVGTTLYENAFHISPDDFLGAARYDAVLRNWLAHLAERQQAGQFREEYLSLISHDLRSPLTNIVGRADLLRRTLARDGLESHAHEAEVMLRNAQRMNGMIEDLVQSTRLESGRMELQREHADVVGLVAALTERIGTPEDRARIRVEGGCVLPQALVDHRYFERIVVNLLTNALKYSPAGSPVMVRFEPAGHEVVVSVTDQGVGIPAVDVPHLFQRYYRSRTGNTRDGLGLGLYITRMLVEAHGGRIWVDSEEGVGSTFCFTLPATTDPEQASRSQC